MNINPQSNTDFTQVTCTVHFYYSSIKTAQKILSCDVREHKFIIYKVFLFFLLKIVLRNKTFCWMCLNVRI